MLFLTFSACLKFFQFPCALEKGDSFLLLGERDLLPRFLSLFPRGDGLRFLAFPRGEGLRFLASARLLFLCASFFPSAMVSLKAGALFFKRCFTAPVSPVKADYFFQTFMTFLYFFTFKLVYASRQEIYIFRDDKHCSPGSMRQGIHI